MTSKPMFNMIYHSALMFTFGVVMMMFITTLLQNAVIHPAMETCDIVGCMVAVVVLGTAAAYHMFMACHQYEKWHKGN